MQIIQDTKNTKIGFISIIGPTNAGKSTLLNNLIGNKVSITSHKVQTTRSNILGVYTKDDTQLVFIDTPGIFNPRRRLDRAMIKSAKNATEDNEVNVLLLDGSNIDNKNNQASLDIFKNIKDTSKKVLVLNKVDLVKDKTELLAYLKTIEDLNVFDKVFMISALRKQGFRDFINYLCENTLESPFMYQDGQTSNQNDILLCQEITREKVYYYCHKEIPYQIMVKNLQFEKKGKSINIHQTIFTTKESHKKIILGEKGANIKRIGTAARLEMCELLKKKVNLFLFVKVKSNWLDDKQAYEDIGLEFDI